MKYARYFCKIAPVPAPRMTKGDRFNPRKRPRVARYFDFRDALRLLVGSIEVPNAIRLEFHTAMPESWSEKKKKAHDEKIQTPDAKARYDTDNLIKACSDSLFGNDGGISVMMGAKYWCREGREHVVLEVFYLEPGDDQRRLFPQII